MFFESSILSNASVFVSEFFYKPYDFIWDFFGVLPAACGSGDSVSHSRAAVRYLRWERMSLLPWCMRSNALGLMARSTDIIFNRAAIRVMKW